MSKKNTEEDKKCCVNCTNSFEKSTLNVIMIALFVCIISILVGGIVMTYNHLKETEETTPTIVSYEEGVQLINIINKLDMLDLIKKDYTNLTDEEFLILVASMTDKTENNTYRVEDLNKIANQYFNRDIKIVKFKCLDCPDELYIYDEVTNSYIYNEEHGGHGNGFERDVKNVYFSSERKENMYYVTVLKAFSNIAQLGCGVSAYYDNLEESNKVIDVKYNMENCELLTDIEKEITSSKGKLNKYTYVFEKKDNKYILKSLEQEE